MTVKNVSGTQKKINESWLNLYCAPFDIVDEVVNWRSSVGHPIEKKQIKNNTEFKKWSIEHIEKLHCQIESTGMQYLKLIRKNDLSFWNTEKDRDEFSFFCVINTSELNVYGIQ